MTNDVDRLADYCVSRLDFSNVQLGREYGYASLPLCVIDAVFSINARYASVQNVVARYCRYTGTVDWLPDAGFPPPRDAQQSIPWFLQLADSLGTEGLADEVLENRQRTSPRSGILKAEAAVRFARALERFGIHYLQGVAKGVNLTSAEEEVRRIPGQGSGLSWQYFLMLAGNEELIKPDRMVLAFLGDALRRPVDVREAQRLLSAVCPLLTHQSPGLKPRTLDHLIWRYQRDLSGTAPSKPSCG